MSGDDDLVDRLRRRVAVLEAQLGKRRVGMHDRNEFLVRAFEDAAIGMGLVSLDDRIVEANAALCQMLGYTREQLLRMTVPDITHPDDLSKEEIPKDEMSEGSSTRFVVEKRYVRSDESVLVGRLSVSAMYDEHGKPAYFIGQIEDVTRERMAERALREREALFRALVESTTDIFCVVDVDGVIRHVSPSLAALGWSPREQRGQPLVRLVHPDDRSSFTAALAEVVANPTATLRTSLRLCHCNHEIRRFDLVGRNRLDVDTVGGIVLTLRDVTEQRALQAQLSQAQRLDSLGRLAGGVAHDFNNMLGVILAMTEFLQLDLAEDDSRRADVATIEETALRARDLTGQLLAIGRRRHGTPQATDLHALLCRAQRLLDKLLGEDIELVLECGAESGWLIIDPVHAEQVVLNLASNARDAMPNGGRFTLRTRSVVLGADDAPPPLGPGRYLELQARDTGIGIDRADAEQIFDPFFTTKQPGRGTGLGLATVYGIVRQADGHIRVDSEPGRGAVFTILWPEVDGAASRAPDVAIEGTGAGECVLLVEDNPSVRLVTTRILERGGYRVTAASEPAEALALVRDGLAVDVLVTDVVMPQLSGPDLYEQIVALRGELPVVFVSGYAKTAQSKLSVHPGFLPKPFTPSALLAKVRERLAVGRGASARKSVVEWTPA